ncbi:MAG: hypothetical protein Q8Q09_27790 [Deltaproteobacteria bacterium]|nr:hypothetical protein [Deltaproteobacteria bacterium]
MITNLPLSRAAKRALWLCLTAQGLSAILAALMILAGPELDTDAFGHFIVARRMIEHPSMVSVHWVWLPLWHMVLAAIELLGGGLTSARWLSWTLGGVTSAVVFAALSQESPELDRSHRVIEASLAAGLWALCPLALLARSSAEPEALFTLLISVSAWQWARHHPWRAGTALALAALCRYEVWPVLGAVALWPWINPSAKSLGQRAIDARKDLGTWLLPALAVLAWCAVHRVQHGEWLWFVRENRAFALRAVARLFVSLPSVPRRAAWYALTLPWLVWGPAVLLAPWGMWHLHRRRHHRWLLMPCVIVTFLSYAWLRGQHLGLVRHAIATSPFYAGAIALALTACARWAQGDPRRRAAFVLCIGVSFCWFMFNVGAHVRGHVLQAQGAQREVRAAAALLAREAHDDAMVFCDDAMVELHAELDRTHVRRWAGRDVRRANVCEAQLATGQPTWVVSTPRSLRALQGLCEPRFSARSVLVLRCDCQLFR